jgi:hypothetical protein
MPVCLIIHYDDVGRYTTEATPRSVDLRHFGEENRSVTIEMGEEEEIDLLD